MPASIGLAGQPRNHPIVALVASAGGLEAVSRVLAPLPASFDGSIIVLIHQSPEHTSRLVDVLRRRCALAVVAATDGATLPPGQVVVVPAGKHLLVGADGRIVLILSGEYPPSRPSADLLLATLATAVGPRAVAVVLSGAGHDGATGATAVHALGGKVFATDEASSSTYAMPLAAIQRDESVDRVLPLDDVAAALIDLTEASPGRAAV